MGKLRPFVRKDSYMPNKKWIPFVIGNGYTTTDGASGPAPEYETVTGNPVSFNAITPFPLKQLKVAFSPVQSLNGYDAPWPAGGGKNKLGYLETGTYSIANVGSISYKKDNSVFTVDSTLTGAFGYRFGNKCKVSLAAGTYYLSSNVAGQSVGDGVFAYNVATSDVLARARAEGGASFTLTEQTEVALGVSLKNGTTAGTYTFQIELGSSATSYAPYSNECPISGWDGVEVWRTGKNLWNPDISSDGQNIDKLEYYGNKLGYAIYKIPVPANSQLAVKTFESADVSSAIFIQSTAEGANYSTAVALTQHTWAHERVLTSNAEGCLYLLSNTSVPLTIAAVEEAQVQIELGSTLPESFTPYNPSSTSISISLGSTVYSGYVDVISGVGEVTMASVDLGSLDWMKYTAAETPYFYTNSITPKYKYSYVQNNWKSSQYTRTSIGSTGNAQGLFITDSSNIRVRDNNLLSLTGEAFKAAMSGVQLVYELATPIPITLTPQEVESLAGDNTMWTDGDSLEVTYRSN